MPTAPVLLGIISCAVAAVSVAIVVLEMALALEGARPRWPAVRTWLVRHLGAVLVLGTFLVVVAVVPTWLPIHDHQTFVSRADCAINWCTRDAVDAWSPPAYHVYGVLLRLMPERYGVHAMVHLGLGLSILSLVLWYAFVVRLFARAGRSEQGRRVATWTLAITALNPIFLRMAVGGTMWPYATCMLAAAGLTFLIALDLQKRILWYPACGFLALAALSNLAVLPWGALVVVAPLSWASALGGTRRVWIARVLAVGAFAVFTVPYAVRVALALEQIGGVGRSPAAGLANQFAFYPSQLPIAVCALWLVGLLASLRSARAFAPVLYAYIGTDWILAAQVNLEAGYPTRFIHGFPSLYFIGFFAALGAEQLSSWVSTPRAKSWVHAALAALVLCTLPTARAALTFLTENDVLPRELAAVSERLPRLPAHDLLVIPPPLFRIVGAPERASDPVEVHFPEGEYHAAMWATGRGPGRTTPLTSFAESPESGRILLYVGSGLRSWVKPEIIARAVPRSTIDRPDLTALRAHWDLVPVLTFELETAQNPLVMQRLGADRTRTVELGFYWLRRRDASVASVSPHGRAAPTTETYGRPPPSVEPLRHARSAALVGLLSIAIAWWIWRGGRRRPP